MPGGILLPGGPRAQGELCREAPRRQEVPAVVPEPEQFVSRLVSLRYLPVPSVGRTFGGALGRKGVQLKRDRGLMERRL